MVSHPLYKGRGDLVKSKNELCFVERKFTVVIFLITPHRAIERLYPSNSRGKKCAKKIHNRQIVCNTIIMWLERLS